MNQVAILYPVFVQVLLTITVYCLLGVARSRALRAAGRSRGSADLAMGRFVWPEDAQKRANNQRNQFELPVLFYAVAAFALIVGGADLVMVVLAWAFVHHPHPARGHPHRAQQGALARPGLCRRAGHPGGDVGQTVPARGDPRPRGVTPCSPALGSRRR